MHNKKTSSQDIARPRFRWLPAMGSSGLVRFLSDPANFLGSGRLRPLFPGIEGSRASWTLAVAGSLATFLPASAPRYLRE